MVSIVLAIRFILEVVTVGGLFLGVFLGKSILQKVLYLLISMAVVFIWWKYGAPKSPHVLVGVNKLLLEIAVYATGSIGFYQLYGSRAAAVYLVVAVVDLVLMYALGLQGN